MNIRMYCNKELVGYFRSTSIPRVGDVVYFKFPYLVTNVLYMIEAERPDNLDYLGYVDYVELTVHEKINFEE